MKKKYGTDSSEVAVHEAASDDPVSKKTNRLSAMLNARIITRLLREESIEVLAWQCCTTATKISKWRDDFLFACEEALKKRQQDGKEKEIFPA